MKKLILMMSLVTATALSAIAQQPELITSNKAGWHKIGDVTANFKLDKDGITVLGRDRFKSIKLIVKDAPLEIFSVEVYYESGESEFIKVDQKLEKGESTRAIDLKGRDRELKKVVFVYKTIPNSKDEKSEIELYGLK